MVFGDKSLANDLRKAIGSHNVAEVGRLLEPYNSSADITDLRKAIADCGAFDRYDPLCMAVICGTYRDAEIVRILVGKGFLSVSPESEGFLHRNQNPFPTALGGVSLETVMCECAWGLENAIRNEILMFIQGQRALIEESKKGGGRKQQPTPLSEAAKKHWHTFYKFPHVVIPQQVLATVMSPETLMWSLSSSSSASFEGMMSDTSSCMSIDPLTGHIVAPSMANAQHCEMVKAMLEETARRDSMGLIALSKSKFGSAVLDMVNQPVENHRFLCGDDKVAPIHWACAGGNPDILKLLLAHGAIYKSVKRSKCVCVNGQDTTEYENDLNTYRFGAEKTPLHFASTPQMVRLLLEEDPLLKKESKHAKILTEKVMRCHIQSHPHSHNTRNGYIFNTCAVLRELVRLGCKFDASTLLLDAAEAGATLHSIGGRVPPPLLATNNGNTVWSDRGGNGKQHQQQHRQGQVNPYDNGPSLYASLYTPSHGSAHTPCGIDCGGAPQKQLLDDDQHSLATLGSTTTESTVDLIRVNNPNPIGRYLFDVPTFLIRECGAKAGFAHEGTGNTPLHNAASRQQYAMCELLATHFWESIGRSLTVKNRGCGEPTYCLTPLEILLLAEATDDVNAAIRAVRAAELRWENLVNQKKMSKANKQLEILPTNTSITIADDDVLALRRAIRSDLTNPNRKAKGYDIGLCTVM